MSRRVQNRRYDHFQAISHDVSCIPAAARRGPEAARMTCPQCLSGIRPDTAFCGSCGTPADREPAGWSYPADGRSLPAASVSQFPRTPGDQYIPSAASGQHDPPPAAAPREFRLDLRRLSQPDQAVGGTSLVVLISLFLPWFGFSALGVSISVSGTTAHGYLVLAVITALLITGYLLLVRLGRVPVPAARRARDAAAGRRRRAVPARAGRLPRPAAGRARLGDRRLPGGRRRGAGHAPGRPGRPALTAPPVSPAGKQGRG